jgi:hypothetical protein
MHPQDTPVIKIPLRARDGSIRAYAIIDPQDAHLADHRWCLSTWGYAVRSLPKEPGQRRGLQVRMNRDILGLLPGDPRRGDHINMNKLDNRRANLRIVTAGQNSQNRPSHRGSVSQYRGVSWSKKARKWHAQVQSAGKRHHLGFFVDEHEAGRAAAAARAQYLPYSTT